MSRYDHGDPCPQIQPMYQNLTFDHSQTIPYTYYQEKPQSSNKLRMKSDRFNLITNMVIRISLKKKACVSENILCLRGLKEQPSVKQYCIDTSLLNI